MLNKENISAAIAKAQNEKRTSVSFEIDRETEAFNPKVEKIFMEVRQENPKPIWYYSYSSEQNFKVIFEWVPTI